MLILGKEMFVKFVKTQLRLRGEHILVYNLVILRLVVGGKNITLTSMSKQGCHSCMQIALVFEGHRNLIMARMIRNQKDEINYGNYIYSLNSYFDV